jgi:hypothetical protein
MVAAQYDAGSAQSARRDAYATQSKRSAGYAKPDIHSSNS